MNCYTRKQLAMIAEKHIPELDGRGDLESHRSDSEDFFETSVWSLESALMAAFWYGFKCGRHIEKLKNRKRKWDWRG